MFWRRITVCSSYQWTWMSGSVLCFADSDPWIQWTPSGRATCLARTGLKSIDSASYVMRRQPLLEPDLGIRIVVVARDVVVAGAFVKCDGLGEGGVGVEPNGLVAKVGSGRFKVAQQPGAEPCAAPF